MLTINALSFAEEIFIVLQTEYLALKTLPVLIWLIDEVKTNFNPKIEITGVIACQYNHRRKIDVKTKEEMKAYFKEKIFRTVIRKNVALAVSPAFGKKICRYAPNSYGAKGYLSLAKEVIKMEKKVMLT